MRFACARLWVTIKSSTTSLESGSRTQPDDGGSHPRQTYATQTRDCRKRSANQDIAALISNRKLTNTRAEA